MHPLISEYISLAQEHGECNLEGSARRGNNIHGKLMTIITQIRAGGESLRSEFYGLLKHENVSVRLWTAVTLLKTFEQESVRVLRNISATDTSILGLNAKTSLDCWNKKLLPNLENWTVM